MKGKGGGEELGQQTGPVGRALRREKGLCGSEKGVNSVTESQQAQEGRAG